MWVKGLRHQLPRGFVAFCWSPLEKSFSRFQENLSWTNQWASWAVGGGRVASKMKCKWVNLRGQLEVGLVHLSSCVHSGL